VVIISIQLVEFFDEGFFFCPLFQRAKELIFFFYFYYFLFHCLVIIIFIVVVYIVHQ